MASTRKRLEALTAGLMLPQAAQEPVAALAAEASPVVPPSPTNAVLTKRVACQPELSGNSPTPTSMSYR